MPKLTIDGIEVEVPAGTNVLEAAKQVGVVIPHFCYHPALGSVGACRLCAMKFIEGPVKGVQVSCMIEARDGMVVSTTDGEAARLRRMVIEWLMLNHPHDCPVCDEGGMCLLQDYTVAGGHGRRRYKGKKRTYADQYLGEHIQQEMNRCIQCYRCSRFYQDYAGGKDFGPMQTANKVFFGRHKDGWLESEFSGNLADVCPTGVFTDKTARFKFRLWDLQTSPSVCPHCSLGCNTIPGARYRELMRVEARENQKVNGWFICDRGRFGHVYARRADRPRRPRAHGLEADYDAVLRAAANRIFETLNAHGPQALAFMGSPRASMEANFALRKLALALGSDRTCYSPDPARERKDRRAVSRLRPGLSRPLREVERSDFIVAAGVDPLNEAPMLALMMRQAALKGARVLVIDPRPVSLPFKFTHVPAPPEALADILSDTLKREAAGCKAPAIVIGTDVGDEALIDRAAGAAAVLKDAGMDAGLFYVMAGPNSFGAALLAGDGPDFEDVIDGVDKGRIKTLVVLESDPVGRYPDGERVKASLSRLETLVVMDYLPTETAEMAGIFIPSTANAEDDGVFVNQEGRAQAFARAYVSGTPINSMGPDPHPPRAFSREVPGHAKPAWQPALDLLCLLRPECPLNTSVSAIRMEMADADPAFKPLAGIDPEGRGEILRHSPAYVPPDAPAVMDTGGAGLRLFAVELTFGTEELSTYADKTQLRAPSPYVIINSDDAAALGLAHGDRVTMSDGAMALSCGLRVSDNVAKGIAIAPRLSGFRVRDLAGKRVTCRKI